MEEQFRDYLKKLGKKEHVVQGLVNSVRLFKDYLRKQSKEIHQAAKEDLFDYAASCQNEKKGNARVRIRGVALYFRYIGNSEMAAVASEIREAGMSEHRTIFRLKDFLWVNQLHVSKLNAVGITDTSRMVQSGRTPDARKKLAERTGLTVDDIVELVKLSDLSRAPGVKGTRARLYHDAGLDTWEKIALLDAEQLRDVCLRFVKATCFPGIPPAPKEAAHLVSKAETLPRIVEW